MKEADMVFHNFKWSITGCMLVLISFTVSHAVLKAKGRFMYDNCDQKVVFRGVEWVPYDKIDEVGKSGANMVRPMIWNPSSGMDGEKLEKQIKAAVDNGMFYSLAPWGNDDDDRPDWFQSEEIKRVLMKWEDYIVIHAMGESTLGSAEEWRDASKATIDRFRHWGYTCPIDILSTTYGRDPQPILQYGEEIFDYDPEKNVIFGCQVYWGDWYTGKYGMTIAEACKKFAEQNFPVQVGACPSDCGNDCWKQVWEESYKNELGCLWWSWKGDQFALTNDATYENLTDYGKEILIENRYAMNRTAVRSQFVLTHGACDEITVVGDAACTLKPGIPCGNGINILSGRIPVLFNLHGRAIDILT
jgi:hypothetical protein